MILPFEESLDKYKNYDLILVETAGRSHKCEEQMDELSDMLKKAEKLKDNFDVEIYLVLSITTKYKDLVNIAQRYEDINSWSIIFTKLDETTTYGNLLNIKLYAGAELSYMTIGQNVPDDIAIFDTQKIVKQLLGGNA